MFDCFVLACALVIVRESDLKATVNNSYTSESEVQAKVTVILYQISNSQKDGVESVSDDFFSQKASSGNRYWVAIDHPKALLENGVL